MNPSRSECAACHLRVQVTTTDDATRPLVARLGAITRAYVRGASWVCRSSGHAINAAAPAARSRMCARSAAPRPRAPDDRCTAEAYIAEGSQDLRGGKGNIGLRRPCGVGHGGRDATWVTEAEVGAATAALGVAPPCAGNVSRALASGHNVG